ncbi:MAG TPA: NAD(P)/FAD-dependent oxidoreductase, partial [Xanthobacteraceae bacterium]
MAIPDEVSALSVQTDSAGNFTLRLSNGEQVTTRSVVIASGARYRRPAVENLHAFEGTSVHYWATPLEGKLCANQEIALIGGGNSAGQAAVYLAGQTAKVWMLIRGADLGASMSRYLVNRIEGLSNIEVVTRAEVSGLEGHNGILAAVHWRVGT